MGNLHQRRKNLTASLPGPRLRKRGPRSAAAKSERMAASNRRAEVREAPAESSFVWREAKFRMLHVSIRGLISHVAELAARIRQMEDRPDLICVNETFLDRTIAHITLEGYALIARLDRSDGRKCRGIAAFALEHISERITLVKSSENTQRFWSSMHSKGPTWSECGTSHLPQEKLQRSIRSRQN